MAEEKSREKVVVYNPWGNAGKEATVRLMELPINLVLAARSKVPVVPDDCAANVTVHQGIDYMDKKSVASVLSDDVDRIVLITPHVMSGLLEMMEPTVEAIRENCPNLKQLVFLSDVEVPDIILENVGFSRMLRDGMQHVIQAGLPMVRLQPASFLQNFIEYEGYAGMLSEGKTEFVTGMPNEEINYIDLWDLGWVVKAIVEAPPDEHNGADYIIKNLTIRPHEFVEALGALVGKDLRMIYAPPDQFKAGLLSTGMPEVAAEAFSFMCQYAMSVPVATYQGDNFTRITGREPSTLADYFERDGHLFVAACEAAANDS